VDSGRHERRGDAGYVVIMENDLPDIDGAAVEAIRLHKAGFGWNEVADAVNTKFGTQYTAGTIAMRVKKVDDEGRIKRHKKRGSKPAAKAKPKSKSRQVITLTISNDDYISADHKAEIKGFDKNGLTLLLEDVGELKLQWGAVTGIIVSKAKVRT
jgi:hypothetical protein